METRYSTPSGHDVEVFDGRGLDDEGEIANLNEELPDPATNFINANFGIETVETGFVHDGGITQGPGFVISWQRGPLAPGGQNGAFIETVTNALIARMEYYQSDDRFACDENEEAIGGLLLAAGAMRDRRLRRKEQGTLGTHIPDSE